VCALTARAEFEALVPLVPRELRKKQAVTASSLEKIEDGARPPGACSASGADQPRAAVYAIAVRTAEFDLPPEMIDDIVARHMSGYGAGTRTSGRDGDRDEEEY
jgi:hypothetical protein